MPIAKKSLGQHWLNDIATLEAMCTAADVGQGDTVLEVGPGHGSLTKQLVKRAEKVIALELDRDLAKNLLKNIPPLSKAGPWKGGLEVVQGDILKFNLTKLSKDYKVVANIPYYLTSKLIRILSETPNPPSIIVLLVQKEVAVRIAAKPGQMSMLGVSAQLYHEVKLGQIVKAELFDPEPKVDSQIVILKRLQKPQFENLDAQKFFQIVKAGFSQRRKKLRGSLSGGLGITKQEADNLLKSAGVDGEQRAQELSLDQWHQIYKALK